MLTMVENGREYILQWPGHSGYVTERFSGLLARQALVDVTLICEEQKLRVHKLVLASCSLYFEEILGEDLGQEPTILLRDLNFNVLKAMIEFMYCGETTVSYIHLPSLLSAARLFKVKELESLVEKMVGSHLQDHNDNKEEYLTKGVKNSSLKNGLINGDDNGIRVSFSNDLNGSSSCESEDSNDADKMDTTKSNKINNQILNVENENCLYKESCNINDCIKNSDISFSTLYTNNDGKSSCTNNSSVKGKSSESVSDLGSVSTTDFEPTGEKNSESNSAIYKKCCDFLNNGCSNENCSNNVTNLLSYSSPEYSDTEDNKVGQCSKVYTHKKRKSSNSNCLKRLTHFEKAVSQPTFASNKIDLVYDSSNIEAPVTLQTNLDIESSNYLLSFSSDNIQSNLDYTLNDFHLSNNIEFFNIRTHIETSEDENTNVDEDKPVLRRSMRLNQQENDDLQNYSSVQVNDASMIKARLSDTKKSQSSNIKLLPKKRKARELERRVTNVKVILNNQTNKKNHSRPLRKATKLNDKYKGYSKSDKEIQKPKSATEKLNENSENKTNEANVSKPNTSVSVNRALWGDMSDLLEDGKINGDYLEYSSCTEIPFAVGLLPLRAALEKLQNTVDHQPRKTRSSIASAKPVSETNSSNKKNFSANQEVPLKKQNSNNESIINQNPSAVCHIEIRTSSQNTELKNNPVSSNDTIIQENTKT